MSYHFRKDLVLENVAGAYIIVALRSAWDEYPFAIHVSSYTAHIWKSLEEGKEGEEVINSLITKFSISEEKATKLYNSFIYYSKRQKYFLEEIS